MIPSTTSEFTCQSQGMGGGGVVVVEVVSAGLVMVLRMFGEVGGVFSSGEVGVWFVVMGVFLVIDSVVLVFRLFSMVGAEMDGVGLGVTSVCVIGAGIKGYAEVVVVVDCCLA
ncbi:hypothetical protein Tco_0534881 [Tanacetum coccineum]